MELQAQKLAWTLPLLIVFGLIETFILVRQGRPYDWRESAASLGVALGQRVINFALGGLTLTLFMSAWKLRLFTLPLDRWWSIALLFVSSEFCYYWLHRVSHECRWFWATHAVHHSPNQLYLSSAYRLGWTSAITGHSLFFLPLVILGFHPFAIVGALAVNLLYQFWLHTELVPSLGWFDRIFNSPANHRVHHATNTEYLDRNYGGVLMVFDHLFGSYAAEQGSRPCHYGLVRPMRSHNPFVIALREWADIIADLRASRSLGEIGGYLFGPPGWSPDGSRMTTALLRQQAMRNVAQQTGLTPTPDTSLATD